MSQQSDVSVSVLIRMRSKTTSGPRTIESPAQTAEPAL